MCLAVPAQLTTVSPDGMTAAAMIGGIEKDVDVSLIDDPKSGDWDLHSTALTKPKRRKRSRRLPPWLPLLPLRHRTTPPPRVLTLRR